MSDVGRGLPPNVVVVQREALLSRRSQLLQATPSVEVILELEEVDFLLAGDPLCDPGGAAVTDMPGLDREQVAEALGLHPWIKGCLNWQEQMKDSTLLGQIRRLVERADRQQRMLGEHHGHDLSGYCQICGDYSGTPFHPQERL